MILPCQTGWWMMSDHGIALPCRRQFLQLASLFGLALGSGCDARETTPVRIGLFPWLGYEPVVLAHGLGYLGDQPAQLLEFSSATQVLRAIRNGAVDLATLTLDEAILLSQDISDLRVILIMDFSNGADVVLSKQEIGSLQELRGRRIGYEATALGAYMLSRALEHAGLGVGDVRSVSVQIDEHERAFRAGEIDAVVTFEPVRSRLLAQGARVLFDSSKMPNEILDVLVTRASYARTNPAAIQAVLRSWDRALKYMAEHPDEANAKIGARMKLSPEELRGAYALVKVPDLAENRRLLAGSPPPLAASVRRLADHMLAQKLVPRAVDVEALLDGGPVLAATSR